MQALRTILQLKVTLQYIEPPIWRRVLVLSSTQLPAVHSILQIVMGWQDCHLHHFMVGEHRYGTPDPHFNDGTEEEAPIRLSSLLRKPGDCIAYEYDFGDGWLHEIELEAILPYTPGDLVPLCTGGQRSCPPENAGGPPGYEHFLAAYHDSAHPEHEDIRTWAGKRFAPEKFDGGAVNKKLAKFQR
jgi:hypothetical protein